MTTFSNKILPKIFPSHYCKVCDYGTSKKSIYNYHLLSAKHAKRIKINTSEPSENKTLPNFCPFKYSCEKCNKGFNNRSGLWKHKKKCGIVEEDKGEKNDIITDKDLIIMLIKQNNELIKEINETKNVLLKVLEGVTHNNSNK
jgi:hypothetical protein